MVNTDLLVIGGGPSGMMAAYQAKLNHRNKRVILIERNEELGKKLLLTGGGRCNLAANVSINEIIEATPKNGKFLNSSLRNFDAHSVQAFFKENHCDLVEEDHHRIFPKSSNAKDVRNLLVNLLVTIDVEILYGHVITEVNPQTKVAYSSSESFSFKQLIIATGGKSFPSTGSDGIGYQLLRDLDVKITQLFPAETPLVSQDNVIQSKELQGLSFKDVTLTVYSKPIKKITHDLLFTHFGLSGPAALRASFFVNKVLKEQPNVKITVDFLPHIKETDLQENASKLPTEAFAKAYTLPKRLLAYLEQNQYNTIEYIKRFPLSISDLRGFQVAFVTDGGVNIKEINPKTLKLKKYPWLSVCGELIDVSSYTGGYNLTIAFSTGFTAGKYSFDEGE